MSLRDEIFRNFTADGNAPRPERCRLRFKEENYSEKNDRKRWKLVFLCFWFRASLICFNNCPTRCNTKQSIIL